MQRFVGFDEPSLAYNRQYRIDPRSPGFVNVQSAIVSPVRPTMEGNLLEELAGGVFDSSGQAVTEALYERSDGRNGIRRNQTDSGLPVARTLPRAVFGGVAFNHFGHFLLEATTRLWALPETGDLPWLFLTDGAPTLKAYQTGFLELLGLPPERIVIVDERTGVDELIVPAPAFTYHHHVTHAYRDTFRRARIDDPRQRGRVFLSRSQTTIALTVGEQELEDVLKRDGWDIVIPERLPPAEQAGLFRADNTLLGLQGSAMHLGLFAPPARKVVHLCRGMAYRGYYVLDDLMEADATYYQAMTSPALPSKPITGPFMLDLDGTIGFLRDEGLLRGAAQTISLPPGRRAELDRDYEGWWHYTESQIRFHRQIDHDGCAVAAETALEPALVATRLCPANGEMLSHATALMLKFRGNDAAAELLEQGSGHLAPDSPQAAHLLHFRSIVEDARGRYDAALAAAEAATALAPGNATYLNQRATVLYRFGRIDEAEALLRELIARGQSVASNHYLLSIFLAERGDADGALEAAGRAVALDHTDEELCRRQVSLLRQAGREDEALARQLDFLEHAHGSMGLLLEVADALIARGSNDRALMPLRRAYRLAPDDEAIAARLAGALRALRLIPLLDLLGAPTNAAVHEQSVMIYRRGLALADAGRMDDALRVGVAAATMNPGNDTIMQAVLRAMLMAERPADARLLTRLLLDALGDNAVYYYVMSLAESDLNRPAAARAAAARAAELAPDNALIIEHFSRMSG